MAFGIAFADIELLIRLSQRQAAEIEIALRETDGEMPPVAAEILNAPETPSVSDSFSAKNSQTNIVAIAVSENIPPVFSNAAASAEKPIESRRHEQQQQIEETGKAAAVVFNSVASQIVKPLNAKQTPPASLSARVDAEIIFRSLLEKFRASVVYDYEMSDAVRVEEDARREHKPLESFSRLDEENRKKAIRDRENLKREALRKTAGDAENQSSVDEIRESKKRELSKKIREANKFL